FTHRAIYNRERHRIEMHLISRKAQTVRVLGRSFSFRAGESIHTESSYKYSLDRFTALAQGSGWTPLESWTDAAGMFSVHALVASDWGFSGWDFSGRGSAAPDRSEIDSQAATTTISADVTIDSIRGDSSAANQPSTQSATMPTPWESCSQPRMVCLKRIVPIRNSSGPPTALSTVLGSE